MGIINIVKTVKEIHKEDIVFVKIGKFYHIYGKDAYIINYLFDYRVKTIKDTQNCGFSENCINKVQAKIESMKINYLILDRKNNYEADEKSNNKNLNGDYRKKCVKCKNKTFYDKIKKS